MMPAEMITMDMTMISLIGEMNEICGRDKDGVASASVIKSLLDKHFPENEINARIRRICDLMYPGVLSGIERDYPSLTRNDILLIALMACGFPTGGAMPFPFFLRIWQHSAIHISCFAQAAM